MVIGGKMENAENAFENSKQPKSQNAKKAGPKIITPEAFEPKNGKKPLTATEKASHQEKSSTVSDGEDG
jgi:hypothetical protein